MSSTFPNLSKIPEKISKSLKSRAGENIIVSNYMCWLRVASAVGEGLVLESFQNKKDPENSENTEKQWSTDNFSTRYGNGSRSGRVGTKFNGDSVYADGNDRAYRPSPVIESLSVQNGQSGLSRKCTFTIKCFSLGQVEKISQHFLEPGYTTLVEFGWNTPQGKSQKLDVLDACNIARHNNYKYTNGKRTNSEGHYDCFLGFITGGGIKSGDGETYLCDVELTTLGEIPSYLQQHKGDSHGGDNKSESDKPFETTDIQDDIDTGDVGKALFKQMVNKLPSAKQTEKVKNLIDELDFLKVPFSSAHNFLNMDDELREKLVERYQDTGVYTGGEKDKDGKPLRGKIPEGAPLFSDQSFIRLELAFKILNTCRYELEATKPIDPPCPLVEKGFSYEIDINSTICRAFPYMFSIDPSILYIPNTEAPEFGLLDALTSTKPVTDFIKMNKGVASPTTNINLAELYPDSLGTILPNHYAFPATTLLSKDDYFETLDEKNIDSTILAKDAGKGYWGYLRNLYINFDFFCETISKSNLVTKDIYLDLLNGISTAANSYWYFDIVNLCDPETKDGAERLTVRDLSFLGKVSPSLLSEVDVFESKGIRTPFLSSQLDFDIPGAMKNHVLGKRISSETEVIKEGKQAELGNLFAIQQDPVVEILNSLKLKREDEEVTENKKSGKTAKKDSEGDIREKNYEIFIGKAAVFPFLNNREEIPVAKQSFLDALRSISEGQTTIQKLAFVGAWKSPTIFSTLDGNCVDGDNKDNINPVLLPIKFEFEVHGISGIRVGDLFKIKDLPAKYTKGVFQVVETSHSIDGSQWKTNVQAKFRNTN